MSLTPGARLGSYEIIALLGAGGMGEVYRANDTKLGRGVALKVLPDALVADADRIARFEREARVLASLNHPFIAQIHGVEESGKTRALVMELVEGEDLAERLARGPIPLDEALPVAHKIAEAIEAAHELGIVHRDLKPANIKVRPDGTVKVLDFGLAKALEPVSSGIDVRPNALTSPTITSPAMTMQGVILGTAAYMAPEQAKGKPADKRVDIWAYGCVLYEMLTAHRPFPGEDISDTLAFVLTKDVDWSALPPATPPSIRTLLRHCLQKNPLERLRDIGDARLAIRDATIPVDEAQPIARPPSAKTKLPWAVAAIAIVSAIASGVVAWRRPAPPAAAETRFVIAPPTPGEELSDPLVSPDGSFVVFKGNQLYVRRLSDLEPRPIRGTKDAAMPFLSPDGRWVGFFADGKLKKVQLAGGDPVILCDAESESPGAAWGLDGRILFTSVWSDGALMAVPADGGAVTPISTIDKGRRERSHWWPEPLPDGRHVLFTIWYAGAGLSESQIGVLDLQTGQHRALFAGALARYAAGHLVFSRSGAYHAVRFDPATLTMTGEPRVVLADTIDLNPLGSSSKPFGLSASGTMAFKTGEFNVEYAVSWLHRDGHSEATPLKIRNIGAMLSHDGKRLAYGKPQSGLSQIAIYDFASNTEQRLQSPGYNFDPIWHPDGQRIAFTSMRRGDFDIYIERPGGAAAEPLIVSDGDEGIAGWPPVGEYFIAVFWEPGGSQSVVRVDAASKARTPLVTGSFEKGWTEVSTDGRWLALCARPAGSWQLYVRSTSAAGSLQPVGICREDNQAVFWLQGSRELLFARGTEVVALNYSAAGDAFSVGSERVVARIAADDKVFGVSPDGQRLLIGKRTRAAADSAGIRVAVNGIQALSR